MTPTDQWSENDHASDMRERRADARERCGPTTHTIPSRSVTQCGMCKYHECTGSLHVRLGPGGWREYVCTHPDAYEPVTDGDPKKAEIRGMLRAMDRGGRHIGKTEVTPLWCPYLRGIL